MNRMQILLFATATGALAAVAVATRLAPPAEDTVAVAAPQDTTFAPATVALGEKIFQGRAAGGICFSCHGANAKGTKGLAPNLTDAVWLHGDGSYSSIVSTIETGVLKPKESAAPMPPKGGGKLSTEQLHAVAAYVYSLRTKR